MADTAGRGDEPHLARRTEARRNSGAAAARAWDDPVVGSPAGSDRRWRSASPGAETGDEELSSAVAASYPALGPVQARVVYSSVHDVAEVVTGGTRYALKLYRPGVRSHAEVDWETGLQLHLAAAGVPVMAPVTGASGTPVEPVRLRGATQWAVLSPWAPGAKPSPSADTYRLLGRLAASIHAAAEDYSPRGDRRRSDMASEVWVHLEAMRPLLQTVRRVELACRLAERLEKFLEGRVLERGICHGDLTLDNLHIDGDRAYAFDFDSSSDTWRAWEPQGVFHFSVLSGGPWWKNWLEGYTSVRPFALADQAAVPWFVLMFEFENTAWRLGLTPTSVGADLGEADLAAVVDRWADWVDHHCGPA